MQYVGQRARSVPTARVAVFRRIVERLAIATSPPASAGGRVKPTLALQLESELDEEHLRRPEVVDHDAHVVHALDRHALDGQRHTRASGTLTMPARSGLFARVYL
jgi:hypothetical protein